MRRVTRKQLCYLAKMCIGLRRHFGPQWHKLSEAEADEIIDHLEEENYGEEWAARDEETNEEGE